MSIKLTKASSYTIEELTEAYNQTRVDYMVPMPMNAARLREYVHIYDIDLEQSLVAVDGDQIIGLGMLAVRKDRTWITRLGLLANTRGKGIGRLVMEGLLANSEALKIPLTMLEVIKGNVPAHNLFRSLGFEETEELLILRRAPKETDASRSKVFQMDRGEIIFMLNNRPVPAAWTNQTESLAQVKGISGFNLYTPEGGHGWLVFQRTLFNLSRLVFGTEHGNPVDIMRELLHHLHSEYPEVDTYTENISADSPHLPALEELGYIETFRRVHMFRSFST
ncbi:MAG: GNAT family N-acetyltransferase [Chloroflexota bacterium]